MCVASSESLEPVPVIVPVPVPDAFVVDWPPVFKLVVVTLLVVFDVPVAVDFAVSVADVAVPVSSANAYISALVIKQFCTSFARTCGGSRVVLPYDERIDSWKPFWPS